MALITMRMKKFNKHTLGKISDGDIEKISLGKSSIGLRAVTGSFKVIASSLKY